MTDIVINNSNLILFAAVIFGLMMAIGIGANDVANAIGTSVGSKALTFKQAIIIAMIFEFCGAYLAGGEVTMTMQQRVIKTAEFNGQEDLLIFGMISSLLAAGLWLIAASALGWPVSTTHSIIGGLIGFTVVSSGYEAVNWEQILNIVGSWVITPAIAGAISFYIFKITQKIIFNKEQPLLAAKKYIPYYVFILGFILSMVTITKGLKHVIGDSISSYNATYLSLLIAAVMSLISNQAIKRAKLEENKKSNRKIEHINIEKLFSILMITTACCMAFAHGSNDVANAIGPIAAITSILKNGYLSAESKIAWWILPMGGIGIVIGLASYGHRVIDTVGKKITHLTPSRGFAAEISTAATVVIASGLGLPISTTQTLVAAVLGVGMARGIAALNLNVIKSIILSWLITLPVGAFLSILIFYGIKYIFYNLI